MAISYQDIRNDRQWRASTGLNEAQFFKLVDLFGQSYESIFGESLEARREQSSQEARLNTYADLLFFGLYSIKSGLTYDLLGLTFDLSNSNVYQNQSLVLRVLETTLDQAGYLPSRGFESEESFKKALADEPKLLIDATEQRVNRASQSEEQKADYSGKKKRTP